MQKTTRGESNYRQLLKICLLISHSTISSHVLFTNRLGKDAQEKDNVVRRKLRGWRGFHKLENTMVLYEKDITTTVI